MLQQSPVSVLPRKLTLKSSLTAPTRNSSSRKNNAGPVRNQDSENVADGNQSDDADDEDMDEDENGDQPRRVKGKKKKAFKNRDLPGYPDTLDIWRDKLLPRWYVYQATVDNPWKLERAEHLHCGQGLWDHFIEIEHKLEHHDDPVWTLVGPDSLMRPLLTLL